MEIVNHLLHLLISFSTAFFFFHLLLFSSSVLPPLLLYFLLSISYLSFYNSSFPFLPSCLLFYSFPPVPPPLLSNLILSICTSSFAFLSFFLSHCFVSFSTSLFLFLPPTSPPPFPLYYLSFTTPLLLIPFPIPSASSLCLPLFTLPNPIISFFTSSFLSLFSPLLPPLLLSLPHLFLPSSSRPPLLSYPLSLHLLHPFFAITFPLLSLLSLVKICAADAKMQRLSVPSMCQTPKTLEPTFPMHLFCSLH